MTAKYINPVPFNIDINLKIMYRDILWLGQLGRPTVLLQMAGVNISSSFNIGYALITQLELNNVSNGTHEIVVGFLLGNRYGDWCPRNVW